ncbi:MAG: MMPL family transporter [Planctomycetota bacterium]
MNRTPTPVDDLPWPLRRRKATLAACVVAMLLGIASALTLRPGTAVRDMLPAQSPAAAAMDRVLQDFRLIDDLMVLVEAEDNEPNPASQLRAFAERFTAALGNDEDVAYVRYDRTDEAARASFLNDLAWSQAWRRLNAEQRAGVRERLTPEAMSAALERRAAELAAPGQRPQAWWDALANDPLGLLRWLESTDESGLGQPRLNQIPQPPASAQIPRTESALAISDDGRALLIRVGGVRPANDLPYSQAMVRRATEAAEQANIDGLTWRLTGPYAIANFSASSTKRDMIVSIFVSLGLLTLLFFVVYRDHRTLPLTLLTVNGGIVVAFGIYALGRGQLSPVTATCGAVLAGLGIDYCVHLLAHARDRSPAALGNAIRRMTPILGAACVTSAIGFAAVAASGVRALTEFAVLGVLGLAATLAMTLTFLPAVLATHHSRGHGSQDTDSVEDTHAHQNRLTAAMRPIVAALFRRPRPWLFATAMISGMAGAWLFFDEAGSVRFADDLEAMHAVPNPPLEAQAEITDRFGLRPSVLFVHLTAPDADALLARSHELDRALHELRTIQPNLHGQLGLGVMLTPIDPTIEPSPDSSKTLTDFDAAVAASPFRADAFAGFRERLALSLEPAEAPDWSALRAQPDFVKPVLPRSFFDGDSPEQAITVLTLDTPWELLEERSEFLADVQQALQAVPGTTLTGLAVVGAEMQDALGAVTERLVWIAALAVVVWLCVFFRNPWEVMAALFPAAIGLVLLACAIGLTGTELHAANLIALPLTLGLGVDDGIFLVAVARRVRRARGTVNELQSELAVAASAIVVTSLTTMLAFGSLAFTRTPAIASLGLLSAVGITACLLASILGLIPVLAMSHSRRAARTRSV